MPYACRALHAGDLAAISRVHRRACLIAYRFMGWAYTEEQVRCWYAGKLPEWDWALAACSGEELVAYVAMTRAHIDQLFVDPDHQRSGLGTGLLRSALDRGLRPATLHVFADNAPARALYERFGFREVDAWWNEQDGARELLYRLE